MSNVIVNIKNGQVDLVSEGINTDISKSQEIEKEEEAHINIKVHKFSKRKAVDRVYKKYIKKTNSSFY